MSKDVEYIDVELPSRGVLYENGLSTVSVRGMYTTEEKYLSGARRDFQGVLDKIFSKHGCIKDLGGMNPSDLLSSDRLFLLFIVRMLSWGKEYIFKLKCDDCDTRFKHKLILMDDLTIDYMKEEDSEPFMVELPSCGKVIEFRLLRGADEQAIDRHIKRLRQRDAIDPLEDPGYLHRLARHIVSIDGTKVDLREAERHMKISTLDSQALKDGIENADSGVDLTLLDVMCPNCDNDIEEVMPFTADFFRTNKSRRQN